MGRPWIRVVTRRVEVKQRQFFFEKKNQKTFARLSRTSGRQPSTSFCVFFQKQALPFFPAFPMSISP
jgi:hypothetical protein